MGMITRRQILCLGAAATGLAVPLVSRAEPEARPFWREGQRIWRWGIDYGAETDAAIARGYDMLVLDPDHARPIAPLRGPGTLLLGYLSLGEVEQSRPFFGKLKASGALLQPNPHWPDARMADLRTAAWRRHVLEKLMPDILAIGYDGIFIDTLDSAEALERDNPVENAGMVAAGLSLVKAIRSRFPQARIMVNRGYALFPGVATSIDAVLGESMASRWSFTQNRYEMLSDADWTWQATRLRAARVANPALALLTLDYWDPGDTRTVAALYARERAAGFSPYVATLALNKLIQEPVA